MSEVKVNKISPRTNCGTVTLGDSGDTFTIPSGATITNAGTATGFGATGEISWDTTVKTTGTFTATAGVGYFCNTTGGTITVNLPAGAAGSSVALVDYANTWDDNNVTVTPNGSEKIGGVAATATLSTEGQSVTFVYIDSTRGWVNVLDSTSAVAGGTFITASVSGSCNTLATCGNYKIATFKGPGTFTVCSVASCATNNIVDYVVVGGGGAGPATGGGDGISGGGGGGGFRYYANTTNNPQSGNPAAPINNFPSGTAITVSATGYPITVGGGGPAGTAPSGWTPGVASVFSSITAAGGGRGGRGDPTDPSPPVRGGRPGGSGGGGDNGPTTGGTGNDPSTSPAQGTDGGDGAGSSGAGGGGGIAAGTNSGTSGSDGGAGAGVTGFGTTGQPSGGKYYFSGGGGGGNGNANYPSPGIAGSGGLGGGAAGKTPACTSASNATANTGGGGGGASDKNPGGAAGGAGGSGIVIIRYKFQA